MAKEKQQYSRKTDAMEAMEKICGKYPAIRPENIEYFAPVYYPIAIVELRLAEQTFEDFETVQLTVLRLMSLGITDYKVIAQTLGLSPNYVFKVIRLLVGYGHLDGTSLTELGRESLSAGKKIVTTETLQKFQTDALNGTLLKVGQVVTESSLNDKSETLRIIGHLSYLDGIAEDTLRSQLTGGDSGSYLQQKSGILHTNVIAIKDARCTQIQYAKCYLLKLRDQNFPIIFAERYDRTQKEIRDRFSWRPFSVAGSQVINLCGFEADTKISSEHATNYVRQLFTLLVEQAEKLNLEEEVPRAATKVFPFDQTKLIVSVSRGSYPSRILVREEAVTQYRGNLINILLDMHKRGKYLLTNEYLYGHLVELRPDSPKLSQLARLVSRQVEKLGYPAVAETLRDEFRDYKGSAPLVDALMTKLSTL